MDSISANYPQNQAPQTQQAATQAPPPVQQTHQPTQQIPQQQVSTPAPTVEAPPIQSKDEKTLYNSSYLSIFFRNFFAGAARSLGGIVMYLLFMTVIVYILQIYVYPQIAPLLETFQNLGDLANQAPASGGGIQIDPESVQQILEQFQGSE